jgi:GDP-L-fucose synthase
MAKSFNKQIEANFINSMSTNLYGPNDNFDLETSHALAAILRKFHEAKINNKPLSIGTGEDLTIKEFAQLIKEVVGYEGEIRFGTAKADGTPRKLLDRYNKIA